MDIINWADFRRGTLAILLVITPTLLLSNFIEPALQSHQITGPGLWQLKLSKVPDTVIEPLHVLRLKPYFFKFRLMNEIELRIADPALFKKYKKKNRIANYLNFYACGGVYFSCYSGSLLLDFMVFDTKIFS